MNESELQKKIVQRLNRDPKTWAVKIHGGPHQPAGLPDIIGCAYGYFFGLEVKEPGKEKTLTERQKLKLRRISEAGGRATVVTSVEQALEFVYG